MRFLVLHDAGGGGGASDFFFAPPRTRRHQSSAARETASREVLTRHIETEVTCCWLDTINNRRLV